MDGERADGCLTEHEASEYAHGLVDDAERLRADIHVDRCDECRWLVSELARSNPVDQAARQVGRYLIRERLGSGAMGVVYAAYDPELDRKVALKLVRPDASRDGDGHTRLLSEARAMARISHPGVVPVYDVSSVGADVAIAMELVDGEDARRWLQRVRPRWREAARVLLQAGRGLAAAHAEGIVHRDIKPANVLIGRDGRARITDFGLARATARDQADAARPAPGTGPALAPAVTRRDGLVGTPAYMAPEQLLGGSATPRSDQFGFSVLLYEAVYGERPFAAGGDASPAQLDGLIADVTAGRPRPAPAGSRVPAWLRRILLRGLAVDPDARWPSLAAMLDRIEDTPRRRRLVGLAALAGVAVLAMAGVVVADRRSLASAECTGTPERLEQTYAAAAWTAARVRIAGLGAYGEVAGQQIDQALDRFRARWIRGHRDACRAHRSGAQSDALLDLRMACLERGRASLAAAGDILQVATAAELADTVAAMRLLPDPDACSDTGALLASVPPPPAELAAAVATADAAIARVEVERTAGRLTAARAEGHAVVANARALGYRPLLARALLSEGRASIGLDNRALAAPVLAEATSIAIEAGDEALAIEAWARGAFVKGTGAGDRSEALAGLDIVEAIARRLPPPSFARALLENNVGAVELARGHRREAADRFERALGEARRVTGPGAVELVNVRTGVALVVDDPARRDALLAEAEAEFGHWLGPDHPETLRLRTFRGMVIVGLAAARDLLGSACAKYEQYHVAAAASATTGCWAELGYVSDELGDRAGALAALARVAALPGEEGHVSPEPAGYLLLLRGDPRGASAHFERAVAGVPRSADAPWWRTLERGKLELGLGRARLAAGDALRARAALDQAVGDLGEVAAQHPGGVVTRRLARAHAALAQALRASGAPASRIAEAARAALALLGDEGARSDEIAELARPASGPPGQGGLADRP